VEVNMEIAESKSVAVPSDKREIGEPITKELILSYMDSFGIGNKLDDNEKTQFINVAVAYKLNPFKREIYCNAYNTKDGKKLSIITGYEVYLKRAERIGDLNGWKVTTTGSIKEGNLKAQIVIHRKSWANPFEHEVDFSEYDLKRSVWIDKPITMIKKVVTAQGFRLAFPDELGGMPYTADELPDNMTGAVTTVASAPEGQAKPPTPRRASAAAKKAPEAASAPVEGFIEGVVGKKYTPRGEWNTWTMEGHEKEYLQSKDPQIIETMNSHGKLGDKIVVRFMETKNGQYTNRDITAIEPVGQEPEEAQVGD
jgi:phage recombination protein Bet